MSLLKATTIQVGGSEFPLSVRRSKKAKRLLLHAHVTGLVELVIPWNVSFREAERFLRDREGWLIRAMAYHEDKRLAIPQRQLVSGDTLPYLDTSYVLKVIVEKDRVRSKAVVDEERLVIYVGDRTKVRDAVIRWYKKQAEEFFEYQVERFSSVLRKKAKKIRISDFKTQWGSCHKQRGIISFSWRLLLASEAVACYVVAHEVAHLKHANHSQAFWNTVELLLPDYLEAKTWIKSHGYTLVL